MGPPFPSRQLDPFVALVAVTHAASTGHVSTSDEKELGRQCPGFSARLCTVLPASAQSMPSLHGRHVPSEELYLPARQTHSVAPGAGNPAEVRYNGCDGSQALQVSKPCTSVYLPASHFAHVGAYLDECVPGGQSPLHVSFERPSNPPQRPAGQPCARRHIRGNTLRRNIAFGRLIQSTR